MCACCWRSVARSSTGPKKGSRLSLTVPRPTHKVDGFKEEKPHPIRIRNEIDTYWTRSVKNVFLQARIDLGSAVLRDYHTV
jgi:hypothetical protein